MHTINVNINNSTTAKNSGSINFTRIMKFDGTNLVTQSPEKNGNGSLSTSPHRQASRYSLNRTLQLKGYVGFDMLASQFVNRTNKEGYSFNILCIGETGIGKSTLMDTLFNASFNIKPSLHSNEKVTLNKNTFDLAEKNISLKLNLIETSGFGDQINKENSHQEIVKYIDDQFEDYVQQELGLRRSFNQIDDTRIHVCLYFICPTGHSLKAIDLNTMKALDRKCNIVPIIAKADTISKNELNEFKRKIMNELSANHVNIYHFPINDYDLNVCNLNATTNVRRLSYFKKKQYKNRTNI
jgi:septin 6/8/11